MTDRAADDDVLWRHRPILVLDRRERFRPIAYDGYVAASTLVAPDGTETPARVEELDGRHPAGTALRFVEPDDLDAARDRPSGRCDRPCGLRDRPSGPCDRLGTVGLFARLLDALFHLSVWLRPTLDRRTASAAAAKARRLGLDRAPACYGRTVRAGEWLVLHYAWFYAMNDWRTGYRGLNDHEGDWEQAWVFCDPATGRPAWIGATSHDHLGADLRRHWDDPEVDREGERPRLMVAAGSHAVMFRPGDYVTRIDVPALRWLVRVRGAVVDLTVRRRVRRRRRGLGPPFGVPFVDAAGGDGPELHDLPMLDMTTRAPITDYRGLWGVDTLDPLQGERGPSGPKFDRAGAVRASWADPLGFVGLHGTLPPSAREARLDRAKLARSLGDLDEQIRRSGRLLPLVELAADRAAGRDDATAEREHLTHLLRQRVELEDLDARLRRGEVPVPDLRAHLRHPATPLSAEARPARWSRTWAALSIPVVLAVAGAALLSTDARAVAVAGALGAAIGGRTVVAVVLLVAAAAVAIRNLGELVAGGQAPVDTVSTRRTSTDTSSERVPPEVKITPVSGGTSP